ncbi:Allantoinase [Spiromyces aspiralis]|uniref:Allantoinase n=1 Tax=Spiromyces aspiralis TaxID=68401 RepID=A0ACC1HJT9_9FUNG|nr:Allantoinase [Spiromyces aspiralis]
MSTASNVATIITGKRVLLSSRQSQPAPFTIYVDKETGKITRIEPGYAPEAATVDAKDDVVMPGIVDAHVHINQPGRTQWEGVVTATHAAAAGGVSTIIDMPLNCLPSTVTPEALHIKEDSFRDAMWVDVGTWGGVVPGNQAHLVPMLDAGARGFKCFLCDSGVAEFPPVNEDELRKAMTELKKRNGTLLFHAEMELEAPPVSSASAPTEYQAFLDSRPAKMEETAIELVIRMCREFAPHVPCHIVHLSAASALPMIRAAKREGLPLTVETCFHYLTLNAESIPDKATEFKCCPPIRDGQNREMLWEGVLDGTIDFVVSDHSPCTPDLKLHPCCGGHGIQSKDEGDFLKAWGGIASVGIGLPLLWTEGLKRGLTLQDIVRLLSEKTAKHSGIAHRKGSLEAGKDADVTIWSPEQPVIITKEKVHFRNKLTPYLECNCLGQVNKTIVRGQVVFNADLRDSKTGGSDECFSSRPLGQWIKDPFKNGAQESQSRL